MIRTGGLVLVIVCGFLLDSAQAQIELCSSGARGQCCSEDECPDGYFNVTSVDYAYYAYYADPDNETCGNPSTDATTDATTDTTDDTTADTTPLSSTTQDFNNQVLCQPCAQNCHLCNGSEIEDCQQCAPGYNLTTSNGTSSCVYVPPSGNGDDKGGPPIGVIAGAAAGGVVVVVVVVVIVVVCLVRRRRRDKERDGERMPGMLDEPHIDMESLPSEDRGRKETEEQQTSKPRKPVTEPTYVNVQRTAPRPVSIERSHDNVLRYTRDPTVKDNRPTFSASPTEERELNELPLAPPPPVSLEPDDEYVITPAPNITPDVEAGQPGGCVTDQKKSKAKGKAKKQPQRSKTTRAGLGGSADGKYSADDRRKTDTRLSPTAGQSAAVSCPELPKFPAEVAEEEEEIKKAAKPGRGRRKVPSPSPSTDTPAERAAGENDGEESDPEKDYINVPGNSQPTGAGRKKHGEVNTALQMEDEAPQDVYANQDAISELEKGEKGTSTTNQPRYSNTATPGQEKPVDYEPMDITGDHSGGTVSSGAAAVDEEENAASLDQHPYVNVRFETSKKS